MGRRLELHGADQHRLGGDVEAVTHRERVVDASVAAFLRHRARGHEQFCRGDVAERLDFPIALGRLDVQRAVTHYLRAIGEQRVRDLVREREALAYARTVRIDLNDEAGALRYDARVSNIRGRHDADAESVGHLQRIERRPVPSVVHRRHRHGARALNDRSDGISSACEEEDGGIRPAGAGPDAITHSEPAFFRRPPRALEPRGGRARPRTVLACRRRAASARGGLEQS